MGDLTPPAQKVYDSLKRLGSTAEDYEREEILFMDISKKYDLEPGIMDLVVWYLMTGKLLK